MSVHNAEVVGDAPPELVKHWLHHVQHTGLNIVALATHQLPLLGTTTFSMVAQNLEPARKEQVLALIEGAEDEESELTHILQEHIQSVSLDAPLKLTRIEDLVVMSCLFSQQDDHISCVSCLVQPPFSENMLDILRLSLGWLWYAVMQPGYEQGERANHLLTLMGDVLAQADAKTAAQEWVNKTKQWTHDLGHDDLSVSLFKVNKHVPKWWVSANVSWAVRGSPIMQKARELSALAITECQEQTNSNWWVFPLHQRGQVSSVLVVRHEEEGRPFDDALLVMLRANANLFEPVFRQWQISEQSLISHGYRSSSSLLSKLLGKGYLAYKMLSLFLVCFICVITLIPINAVVTGNLYVEGEQRYVITAPQQGYIESIFFRPGDDVKKGQLVAQLEDKDLKLQLDELNSQLEQANSKFRQAMASMNAADGGVAANTRAQVQSKIDLIQSKLQKTRITSPIDGVLVSGDWQQKIGTPVEVGVELFQIANVNSYRVILHIPDKDMDSLKIDQKGRMKLTSLPNNTFGFTVKRLTAVAEVKDGVNGFTVEAVLDGFSPELTSGMQGIGKVIVGKTNLLSAWTHSIKDWMRLKLWAIW